MTSRVPLGRVTTYGAIAKAIGSPRAARAVGNALSACSSSEVPCHRVIRADGLVVAPSGGDGLRERTKSLAREGVEVNRGRIDLSRYLFVDFS